MEHLMLVELMVVLMTLAEYLMMAIKLNKAYGNWHFYWQGCRYCRIIIA